LTIDKKGIARECRAQTAEAPRQDPRTTCSGSASYVEIPSEYAADRPDLPICRHRFGIIATTRQLTAKERYTFDLEQVSGPPYSKD